MANVTIIVPPQIVTLTQIGSCGVPPIGASYIAGYMEKLGHTVEVIDGLGEDMYKYTKWGISNVRGITIPEIVNRIPRDTEVIGISNMWSHAWPVTRDLTIEIKKVYPKVPIILGGVNPTSLTEQVLSYPSVDYCVLGEGEETMRELVAALESGSSVKGIKGIAYRNNGNGIVINPKRERRKDLDSLPYPAYHKIPLETYIQIRQPHGAGRGRSLPIIGTRGCPFSCTFCTAPKVWSKDWITRDPSRVVDEIQYHMEKYKADDFQFEDLTAITDKDWIMRFSEELMRRNIKISWQLPCGTRTETFDEEVARTISKAGCTNITFAPESGSVDSLRWVQKKLDLNNVYKAARYSVKAGITVCGFVVIGFPNETKEDIKNTFKMLRKLAWIGFNEVSITTFTAIPGSEIFYELLKEKKVELNDEFYVGLLCMSDLMAVTSWNSNFTDKQLARLRVRAYMNFFFFAYLFRPWRFFKSFKNVILKRQENKLEKVVYDMLCKWNTHLKSILGMHKNRKDGGKGTLLTTSCCQPDSLMKVDGSSNRT